MNILNKMRKINAWMYVELVWAQVSYVLSGKHFLCFPPPSHRMSLPPFISERQCRFEHRGPWSHLGNLGFLQMVSWEVRTIHSPFLIPALFISKLMIVCPLWLAKHVTNPSGHWCRFQTQLQRGEEWRSGSGCCSSCLYLHCLIKPDKYIMATSAHGRPGCWPRITLISGSLHACSLSDSSSHGFTHLSINRSFRRWPYWIYFRSGLSVLEQGVLT